MTTDRNRIDALLDWMADGGRSAASARSIIDHMCGELVAAGVPVTRFALFIYTLHPNIGGRRFIWTNGSRTEMYEASRELMSSAMVRESPAVAVMNSGKPLRQKLGTAELPLDYEDHRDLRQQGMTDTLVQPLPFTTGGTHSASWSTRHGEGFSGKDIGILGEVRPLLARLTENYTLRLNAANLLTAYVGRNSGERILAGNIVRGDTEIIEAAILFADLKEFTTMSNVYDGSRVIETLNRFFDPLVGAITAQDGEVLKFLGDGVLAIFPRDKGRDDRSIVGSARQAVADAARLFRAENEGPGQGEKLEFRAGLCLGRIHFGNIGGGGRLDFTAIGPAVNLASRLLDVATQTGHDVVCSRQFAELTAGAELIGEFPLKGFDDPQDVFALPVAPTQPLV